MGNVTARNVSFGVVDKLADNFPDAARSYKYHRSDGVFGLQLTHSVGTIDTAPFPLNLVLPDFL